MKRPVYDWAPSAELAGLPQGYPLRYPEKELHPRTKGTCEAEYRFGSMSRSGSPGGNLRRVYQLSPIEFLYAMDMGRASPDCQIVDFPIYGFQCDNSAIRNFVISQLDQVATLNPVGTNCAIAE